MISNSSSQTAEHARGQTAIDFLIAMILFLSAFGIVFTVVGPYITGDLIGSDTTPQATHSASYLLTERLAADTTGSAAELDGEKVQNFFAGDDATTADTLPVEAGAIEANATLKYSGPEPVPLPFRAAGGPGTRTLTRGPTPPRAVNSSTTRSAAISGHTVTLSVSTWRDT